MTIKCMRGQMDCVVMLTLKNIKKIVRIKVGYNLQTF